jgi:hypothetical protein
MSTKKSPRFTVHSTTDYSVFKRPDYQRDVKDSYIEKIMSSIKREGQIEAITVDVSGNVVDGQHRLEALKRLKMPVWYCINHALEDRDKSSFACKSANNVSNKWTIMSYVNWAKRNGNDIVGEAEAIANEWSKLSKGKLTVPGALELLNGTSTNGVKKELDTLNYRINYETAKNVFDFASFLQDYVVGNPFSSRMLRPLKKLAIEKDGLNVSVAKKMCSKKHIRVFASQSDNYDFIKELYEKYE